MSYEIKLPQFEGPFDLLLFFIERDELDIYDIPIAKITDDFLEYLHHLQRMNIEVASEFILVAATLMRIKAKMLLPRKELDEEGNEIDPREELVARLIEYKRYKSVLDDFKNLEAIRQSMVPRGNVMTEIHTIAEKYSTEAELDTLSLYRLMKAFEKVLERLNEPEIPQHRVIRYNFTLEGQKEYLINLITYEEDVAFEKVFEPCRDRVHAIFTFLAMLELAQQQIVHVKVGMGMNNFWISRGNRYVGVSA